MTNSADPDLDLHCLLRQGMSCLVRKGLRVNPLSAGKQTGSLVKVVENLPSVSSLLNVW